MITLEGNTFASRVLSSILYFNDLKELITKNIEEYEKLAIKLGSDKTIYLELKKKVKDRSINCELFNNEKFTKDLENIYKRILTC